MIELTETTTTSTGGCCLPELAPRLDTAAAKALSDDLGILGHPIRLQILDMLAQQDGHVCVCDLEGALPVKQPTVSHHIKLLRGSRLIDYDSFETGAVVSAQIEGGSGIINGELIPRGSRVILGVKKAE